MEYMTTDREIRETQPPNANENNNLIDFENLIDIHDILNVDECISQDSSLSEPLNVVLDKMCENIDESKIISNECGSSGINAFNSDGDINHSYNKCNSVKNDDIFPNTGEITTNLNEFEEVYEKFCSSYHNLGEKLNRNGASVIDNNATVVDTDSIVADLDDFFDFIEHKSLLPDSTSDSVGNGDKNYTVKENKDEIEDVGNTCKVISDSEMKMYTNKETDNSTELEKDNTTDNLGDGVSNLNEVHVDKVELNNSNDIDKNVCLLHGQIKRGTVSEMKTISVKPINKDEIIDLDEIPDSNDNNNIITSNKTGEFIKFDITNQTDRTINALKRNKYMIINKRKSLEIKKLDPRRVTVIPISQSIDTISISSAEDDIQLEIDSDHCSGYNSSDFEFISEEEAKKEGITIKNHKANATENPESAKIDSNTDNLKPICKTQNFPNSESNISYATSDYSKYYARNFQRDVPWSEENVRSYREIHTIPEGDDFLNLFQGVYAMGVMNNLHFGLNKAAMSAKCMNYKDSLGFNINLFPKNPADDDYKEESEECSEKIRSMYPQENSKKGRVVFKFDSALFL